MRAKGRQDGVFAGDTVPYVICRDGSAGDNGGNGAKSTTGLAARAYHPDEVREQQRLDIDVQYYLANQLHPVVSRLCAALDATSDARLAECLGLDPTSYQRPAESRDSFAEVRVRSSGLLTRCTSPAGAAPCSSDCATLSACHGCSR